MTRVRAGLALGALLGAAVAFSIVEPGWDLALSITRASGWLALVSLALALVATPIARLARWWTRRAIDSDAGSLRRAFGIAAATLAIAHAAAALAGPLDGALSSIAVSPRLRAGFVALLVLIALLVTSFPSLVRRLRARLWKPLHRLAYVAAGLAFVHVVLSPYAPRAIVLALFGALVLVGLARLLPRATRDC